MSKRRVLFVSRTRYRLPLNPSLRRKWDALGAEFELRVLASGGGRPSEATPFVLVGDSPGRRLAGALFWALLPFRVARLLRSFDPDAIVAQSPYEAAAVLIARRLTRSRARVVTDVQGDWRTATRLYGSRMRAVLSPLTDAVARSSLRRVDAVRTISLYTTGIVRELGIEPAATFPTFIDLQLFAEPEPCTLPAEPLALFVGVLEPYKNVDGLALAWGLVIEGLPGARLHIVGKGTLAAVVEALRADHPESVRWTPELDAAGVSSALDSSTLLVLPSRSEGMGRVVIEAFCRARPVVGTRTGGIADLVADDSNGLLVEPGDTEGLATALLAVLSDDGLARRLGAGARESADHWLQTPEQFALRTRELIEDVCARHGDGRPPARA